MVKEKVITFDIVRSHGNMKVDIFRTGESGFDIEIKAFGTHYSLAGQSNRKSKEHRDQVIAANQPLAELLLLESI